MRVPDVTKAAGTKVRLSDYSHIIAFHACRIEDEQVYRTRGLWPYTRETALVEAYRKLEGSRVSKERIDKEFAPLWEEVESFGPKRVWLMLETRAFLQESCHYLLYGSEFMNALAMRLGCRERLMSIGKPAFIQCAVPLADIAPCWLNGLESSIKHRGTSLSSIAVPYIAPENILDITYPTGIVQNPYTYRSITL